MDRNGIRKPDFFIVGAPKCGTTAMNDFLRQHPDIFIPDAKELQFFGSDIGLKPTFIRSPDRFGVSREQYLDYFAPAKDQARLGESTVWYLYSTRAAAEIKEFCPDADIIIMLRHPVDMMYSLYHQYRYDLHEDIETFEQALAAEDDRRRGQRLADPDFWAEAMLYRRVASFSSQVKRYLDVFGRDKVHILLLDDMRDDTPAAYRGVLEFLGVDPQFAPDFQTVNPARSYRSKWLHQLSVDPPRPVQALLRPLLRNAGLRTLLKQAARLVNTKTAPAPPPVVGQPEPPQHHQGQQRQLPRR